MGGTLTWRRRGMQLAERYHLDDQLKRLRAVGNPGLRRDLHDHASLRLLFAALLRPDAHVIDVGANHGAVLAELVRLTPHGRWLAFEPVPELRGEIAAAFPDVDVRDAALAERAGEASFNHVLSADGYSGLRRRSYPHKVEVREIVVRTARLDDELPDDFRPALIKVDVEGGELGVLRGAQRTLETHRPTVIFEHGQGAAEYYGTSSGEVWDVLNEAGLRIFDLAGVGPYTRAHFEAAFTQPIWNWMAR